MFSHRSNPMRLMSVALAGGLSASAALAQAPEPYESVEALSRGLQRQAGSPRDEALRVKRTGAGLLRFLGTPPQSSLPVADPGLEPELIATRFLSRTRELIGTDDPAVGYATLEDRETAAGRAVVKLQQTFADVRVFASNVIVQLGVDRGVECLITDIDRGPEGLRAAVDELGDVRPAREFVPAVIASLESPTPLEVSAPSLQLFSPEVLGLDGEPVLVWVFETGGAGPRTMRRFLVDAVRGEVVQDHALAHSAIDRQIYDANNVPDTFGILARAEGQGPSGVTDVDLAYDFLGDCYDFYWTHHGRDSYDDAGGTLYASVRNCQYPEYGCPMGNAFGGPGTMWYGDGWVTDDVTAHEITHGVTGVTSELVYQDESGAINESLSDIWGEFIDLENGAGNDSPGVRWLMGEDLPIGAIRNMAHPPAYADPDRMGSPHWYTGTGDHGGVHTNSGVSNKLCYLLTDGDEFNGQFTFPMGIAAVADLYYEAQVNLLMSASDYADLNDMLQQAAVNLGWPSIDRENVYRACVAVEIETTGNLYVDLLNDSGSENGSPAAPFDTIGEAVSVLPAQAHLTINSGTYDEALTISVPSILGTVDGTTQIGAENGSDACEGAVPISDFCIVSFDNAAATLDGPPACDEGFGAQIDHDIWYRWTPAATESYVMSTCGRTTVDTKIAVYLGTDCGSATLVACSDDACGGLQSEVTFAATAGAQYLIRVGTYFGAGGDGGSGAFSILPAP